MIYYEFHENNVSRVTRSGSVFTVKDRIVKDDGADSEITTMLKNLTKQGVCKVVDEAQALSVQASFALNDPHHALREQMRQQILAEIGTVGMGTSANVNNPNAGVTNEVAPATKEATAAAAKLATLAKGNS